MQLKQSCNDYKYELLMSKIAEKEMVLTEQRPKYLWVFREYENNDQKVQDVIYDATQPYAKNPKIIKYDYARFSIKIQYYIFSNK